MEQIKDKLDMESINNQQYIGMMENWIAYAKGRINAEVFYQKDKELLELSVKEEHLKRTELYYFSYIEIILYTHLANILWEQEKQKEGIVLLEKMLRKIEKSQVGLEYWWEGIKVSIFNLACMLSNIGDYKKSLRYMKDFTDRCFKLSDGKFVGYGLGEQAFDLEQLKEANKATRDRLLIQAFYLTDFYDLTENHKRLKEYYETHYDTNKQWY